MAARLISLICKGLYLTLVVAVALLAAPEARAQTTPAPKSAKLNAPAAEHDPLTEWELINGAANELHEKIKREPSNETLREQMMPLALRSALGAERALAIGDASLFDAYRTQFREQFPKRRWRLVRSAQQGDGAAEFALGVLALHGYLEAPAVETACRYFAKALGKGYAGAAFRMSQCLRQTDPARSAVLLREAAASGHPAAEELIGRACLEAAPQDAVCALENLAAAAAAGRPSAQSVLAWMLVQGTGGRAPDEARAARLYLQAARAGDTPAQNNMGEIYESGRGVQSDPAQAADWYRKAAEAGFGPAQFNLGRLYAEGRGVQRDFTQARKWLESAGKAGVAAAQQALEWIGQQEKTQDPAPR